METAISIYVFVIGLAFGSFALAMVDRMKAGTDWVKGRSECDTCKHVLRPVDLVPLFSWLSTKGKCRYCQTKLSVAYPLTELLTGLTFVLSYVFFPYSFGGLGNALLVLWLGVVVISAALIVFDLRWFLLPNKLVYPLIGLSIIFKIVFIAYSSTEQLSVLVLNAVLGVLVAAGFFFVLHAVSKGKWIGDGDVRLGVAIGLLVEGPIHAWLVIFFASVIGVVVALPKLAGGTKNLKMKLPFGPLLLVGLLIVFLFGSQVIDWYTSTFLFI